MHVGTLEDGGLCQKCILVGVIGTGTVQGRVPTSLFAKKIERNGRESPPPQAQFPFSYV